MTGIQFKIEPEKDPSILQEERLLMRFSWCCKQFRENTSASAFQGTGNPTA